MTRVHVMVEGQTEETFVRDVLYDHLHRRRVFLNPILLSVHEFEGLLFSDTTKFANWFDAPRDLQQLTASTADFQNPEHINEGPNTAPSKRVETALGCAGYQKTVHGPLIAMDIGLERMRQQCPHFDQWVTVLEHLAS